MKISRIFTSSVHNRRKCVADLAILFIVAVLATGAARAQYAAETVFYSFSKLRDGASPQSTLVLDSQGNLYGTTQQGLWPQYKDKQHQDGEVDDDSFSSKQPPQNLACLGASDQNLGNEATTKNLQKNRFAKSHSRRINSRSPNFQMCLPKRHAFQKQCSTA